MNAYDYLIKAQSDPQYWGEVAKSDFALTVHENMFRGNITASELSQLVGVSKQYISKILGGDTNFTIESMAKLLFAFGLKLDIKTEAIDYSGKIWPSLDRREEMREIDWSVTASDNTKPIKEFCLSARQEDYEMVA